MDAGLISTIVSGATNLTGTFLNFGASIYATNHMQGPMADEYNYNIVIPEKKPDTATNLTMVAMVILLLIIVLIGGFFLYKNVK